jgi:transposase
MSVPDPTTVAPRPITAEDLPDDTATLKQMILELLESWHDQKGELDSLRHRLDLLLHRLYGSRRERFDPQQLLLFAAAVEGQDPTAASPSADLPEPAPQTLPKRRARPHGRRRLPEHLPHEPRHHELPEAERVCPDCGQIRVDIGVDKSEQLEYRPASLFVVEHFVHKYVCPQCRPSAMTSPEQLALPNQQPEPAPPHLPEPSVQPGVVEASSVSPAALPTANPATPAVAALTITPQSTETVAVSVAAPAAADSDRPSSAATPGLRLADPSEMVIAACKPPQPIDKGLPGPGLLAHLIVSKYIDHLPLYRLERIYEREGLFLPRSTLSGWLGATAKLLRPLYDLLVAEVLQSRAVHTDDTPVKMQELITHHLHTSRLWVYLGDTSHPYNVFDFTLTRKRDGPQEFLRQYQGYLQADAFSGYDGLYLPDPRTSEARIVEVACNAHARRKFYEARDSDGLRAHQALAYYRQLYELERAAKDFSEEQRLQMRQELAVPILDRFHTWLEEQRPEVLPKSPMGEAMGYALNNWIALVRYTDAGFLAIDNNVAEREMKKIALGRKNWLTIGSPQAGETAAILFSMTSTCQRLQVEPWAYLQDVLTRWPSLPVEQRPSLLPDRWQATRRSSQGPSPASAPETNSSSV